MTNRRHLPFMGVGPVYVALIVLLTLAGIALSVLKVIPVCSYGIAAVPIALLGIILIVIGLLLWCLANFKTRIDAHIANNELATTGVYALVRNPIYSAFMLACTGALLIADNAWLLFLPFVFWALMTVLMKTTEEQWLLNLYGESYRDYCRDVNRCIPWPPRRKR